jgi:phosphinothricin acetyltransferase
MDFDLEEVLAAVRDAREDDLEAIVAIYNASIPARLATADTVPITVESRRAWLREHDPARRPLWVVEHNGEVIAWLSLRSFYGRPAYHATAEASVYIAPTWHSRGLGTALMQKIIARCPELGIENLVGFVFAHNGPSMAMNRKLGFEQWGFLPGVAILDGVQRDLIIVGLKIPVQTSNGSNREEEEVRP